MATIHYGDAYIRIGEMSRATALGCFRELEFMVFAWINAGASEEMINRDIATMIAVAAPVVVTQDGKVIRSGDVTIALPDNETFTFSLPLTREQFGEFSYSLSDMWLDAAVSENQHFQEELKKALSRITQMLSAPQSGSVPSPAPTMDPLATPTTGINVTGTKV